MVRRIIAKAISKSGMASTSAAVAIFPPEYIASAPSRSQISMAPVSPKNILAG